jgi:hypothetical protein
MQERDWVLSAAISSLGYEPTQAFAEAIAVARELFMAWPNLDPNQAVQCFFAPEGNVSELIVCESLT